MSRGARSGEHARIAELERLFGAGKKPEHEVVGIGDDAAVFALWGLSGQLVWTVDAQVEHVHFERAWLSWEELGARSFMAAASDLAAMAADPVGALSAIALPPDVDDEALLAIAGGQRAAADALGIGISGGNLTRAREVSITTTLLGSAPRAIRRSGARPGERVWISGTPGLASLGLSALRKGVSSDPIVCALHAFRSPRARIEEARAARILAGALIDLSDGLACDLSHVCRASGVGARLVESSLVQPDVQAAAVALDESPLEAALFGGEDYALLATSRTAIQGFIPIGTIVSEPGLWLEKPGGALEPLSPRGHDHFA